MSQGASVGEISIVKLAQEKKKKNMADRKKERKNVYGSRENKKTTKRKEKS